MSSSRASGSGSAERPRLVLGTAGHIDHGKTTLIRALTGVDCDRLPEEKQRGITIELGFAALDLGDGLRLSVVDVPGHERLVRTMVAGASGIDLVLLVVAADEGVMPQTREHVAVCDLLGVDHGVVALTKSDLVDEEMIELASEEIGDLLATTALASAAVVPVSAVSAVSESGLETLRSALREAASSAAPRTARSGPPRLGVDRVFAMKGFGTIVTGTLIGAPLSVGAAIELFPSGRRARVRGLQLHGEAIDRALPGARCAVNLQGIEVSEVSRGEVLSLPDSLLATETLDVTLKWLDQAPLAGESASVEFLSGTSERRAHIVPIGDGSFQPGERIFARVHSDDGPLALLPGDRFIARGFARNQQSGSTLAGGTVLDVRPPHRRRGDPDLVRELAVLAAGDAAAGLAERVRRSGLSGVRAADLVHETGIASDALRGLLAALAASDAAVEVAGGLWIGGDAMRRLEARLTKTLDEFHDVEPLRPGMARATLLGSLPENVPAPVAEAALRRLTQSGVTELEGDLARRAGHAPQIDSETQALLGRIRGEAKAAGLEPPSPRDWAESLAVSSNRFADLVAHLAREQQVIRAPGDLWFWRPAVDELRERVVAHLEEHGRIDTAAYKQLTGTSRRTTVPLMELLDELHVTRRDGDARVLRSGS